MATGCLKNGENGHFCIIITKALPLVTNQKMELCLYILGSAGLWHDPPVLDELVRD